MNKIVFLILCFSMLIPGMKAQEQISISRFEGQVITGIEASGAFEITIREGEDTGATVNIPSRFQDQLVFSLNSKGVLKIGFQRTIKGKKGDRYTAEVVCSALQAIDLSGACRLSGQGDFTSRILFVDLSGAAGVEMGGNVQVSGEMKIGMSGASKFAGRITADKLDVGVSGASGITLSGKAEQVRFGASGASKGQLGNLIATKMSVGVSGASRANVNVVEEISVGASGASTVDYTGSPRVVGMETSGSSSVNKH